MSHRALRRRHALRLGLAVLLLGGLAVAMASPGFGSRSSADVHIIGEEEVVYDWSTERCAMRDFPDGPVSAFRDAQGRVQLVTPHAPTRRMVGKSLDSLQRECEPVFASDHHHDPSQFNAREWLWSPYTTDGETVYALVHNEFHGDDASDWDAGRDFSGTQGRDNWRYEQWNGLIYRDMSYDDDTERWQGRRDLCRIRARVSHPHGSCEPARTWVSPIDETVTIRGNAHDVDPDGGDGVIVRILKNREQLWSRVIPNGDSAGHDFHLEVPVDKGDAIRFRVGDRTNPGFDSTYFDARINVGPDPCPSDDPDKCQMMAMTLATSTDGGDTYVHADAPAHRVASLPYRYEPDGGKWGVWQASDIVRNPDDGYYYAALHVEEHRQQRRGTCIMRTQSLDDPRSWRAWDGEGFNVRFVDPYRSENVDPSDHLCEPVLPPLTFGLTYSRYFGKFVLTGVTAHNVPTQGFYYALSDDLVHWTRQRLLMATKLPSQVGRCAGRSYPTLLDPGVESRNFSITGQRPYLYFTRFRPCTPQNRGLERDVVRVKIEFQR